MNSKKRLLLCTDMDRTVLPNGVQPESPDARKLFARLAALPQVTLAYVTGRHLGLVEKAIRNFSLPTPDYIISDVGTRIYQRIEGQWHQSREWKEEISRDWGGKGHQQIRELLRDIPELQLQETAKQSAFKLSYYVALHVRREPLLVQMQQRLERKGIDASLVWSVDEPKGIGLLDVLPRHATKLHAIDFLRRGLGYDIDEVVFAGDSGNDLQVMASPIPSVLVANASDEVKQHALDLARENGNQDGLYIAEGRHLSMNGNYASGVLEGVWHFAPAFRTILEEQV